MPDDRDQEKHETYHKVDKRVGHEQPAEEVVEDPAAMAPETPEQPSPQATAQEPDTAAEAPEEPHHHDLPEEAVTIDVYALLRMSLGMFVEQAWVQMGLQLAPGAKELTTDLKQARLAIDTVNFMKEALGDTLSPAERREVDQLLTTLRMNFVQRS